MPIIKLETTIQAPIERVFDLSRSIDLHLASTDHTNERAVAGRMTGLIELGEDVTWRAKHFGVWQELTSRITAYDRPNHFRDSMVSGIFKRFDHDHFFTDLNARTQMRDVFSFESPFAWIGKIADYLFLTAYLRRFLMKRNLFIKQVAESQDWGSFVVES